MSRKIALLFPGQGSQYVGMGRELCGLFPVASQTFEEASDALGQDMSKLCFEGPEEDLRRTVNTQPAIVTVSVAAWRVLSSECGIEPSCAAGHSLGEYAALVVSGAMDFPSAVTLVRKRGQYMQEAVPEGEGAMAALLGLDREVVEELCAECSGSRVVRPANYNAPGQVVVSGHADAVERVSRIAKERWGRKAVLLPVSAPFHSPLMIPAGERLRRDLEGVRLGKLGLEVISNVDAAPYPSAQAAVDLLTRQVSEPVRWQESMERIEREGVDLVIEVGPKKVLAGLMRRIAPGVEAVQMEDSEGLRDVLKILG
jgi:[acyl-carrier-protein] S-malonyltransferase